MATDIFSSSWKSLLVVVVLPGFLCEEITQDRPPEVSLFNGAVHAICKMKPNTKLAEGLPKIHGRVLFKQSYPDGALQMVVNLRGFPDDTQPRAIHIHQFGDLSNGCDSTGSHYNPYKVDHPGHPGDFGNFVPIEGRMQERRSPLATLFGVMSVLGRAVVVHEGRDDLGQGSNAGSLLHGNAGRRIACCIIGISTEKLWNKSERQLKGN